MRDKLIPLLLVLAMLLSACGEADSGGDDPQDAQPLALTATISEAQDTLDPAKVTAQGGEMILHHLYENLLRWEDDGAGWASLAPGQAESYTVETDYAGNATYTFILREDASWSDGRAVTASDFVAAWRRLADPANDLPHRRLLEPVSGYAEVQETGDASLLAVSAPDARTFVVALSGSCAWFLEELCAGAYTMPARAGMALDGSLTNGPYTAAQFSPALITLQPNERYYDQARIGPDSLQFVLSEGPDADYERFSNGERQLLTAVPENILQQLSANGTWTPEPVTALTAVLLNTQQAPFDDPDVRLAFRLAVNTQAVADAAGSASLRAAVGVVPYGVADYGTRPEAVAPEEEESSLPDPYAAPAEPEEEPAPTYWDFRSHSLEKVTVPVESDHAADCQEARSLLSQAGYPGGAGFPAVEYIYVKSDEGAAIAAALCAMWKQELGVTVTALGLSQEEYDTRVALVPLPEEALEEEPAPRQVGTLPVATGDFIMAAQVLTSTYSDAGVLLERWYSASEDNVSGYVSDAFDILLDSAQAAVSHEVRDAYLHDAEAILLAEAPVIPVCCQGGGYLLAQDLTGLFRGPDGLYFLYAVSLADISA